MTCVGPWGQDECSDCVLVVIERVERIASNAVSTRWRPVGAELAAAINQGAVASFNTFLSLAPEHRAIMAPLYERPARGSGAGSSNAIGHCTPSMAPASHHFGPD